MYLASEFNKAKLFQRFEDWVLSTPIDPTGRVAATTILLHRATAAYFHLRRIEVLSDACKSQFDRLRDRLALGTNRISFWSAPLAELLCELSPFFGSMVIVQNALLSAIASRSGRMGTLPSSLRDFVAKASHYPWLDTRIVDVLTTYWREGGQRLRYYRDVDQHFYILSRHSFLDLTDRPRVRVLLPDNPEIKSPRAFSFQNSIDAIDYCPTEFRRLHDAAEAVAEVYGFQPSSLQQPLNLYEPYTVTPIEQSRTIALVIEDLGEFEAVELGQAAGETAIFTRQLARMRS